MAHGHRDDPRRMYSARAFLFPVVWIAILVVSYIVLADWHSLPGAVTAALSAIG